MKALQRISFTILTQGLLGLITFITGIIMPHYMGPEEYGYWQLFFFYAGYLNILGLGFNDGLTLNYAGYTWDNLPYHKLRSAIWIMIKYSILITLIMFAISLCLSPSKEKTIYMLLTINIIPTVLFCILTASFLAVNRSITYNIANLIQRSISGLACLIFLFVGSAGSMQMMLSETAARIFTMILLCFLGRQLLIGKKDTVNEGFTTVKTICSSGTFIMLSVLTAGLIPIFGRLIIQWKESIEVYGIYSFVISLLSIILTFTNTIGIVIFPMLKKIPFQKRIDFFDLISTGYEIVGALMYYIYVPIYLLIYYFMTDYIEGLSYLYILLAICYPLGKIQLILVPYYKMYRLEKALFAGNLFGLLAMVAATTVSYLLTNSVQAVAIATTLIMLLYYKGLEWFLLKKMGKTSINLFFSDLSMTMLFLFCAGWGNMSNFVFFYSIVVGLYFYITRKRNKLKIIKWKQLKSEITGLDIEVSS